MTALDSQGEVYEGRTTCCASFASLLDHAPVNERGGRFWACNLLIAAEVFASVNGFAAATATGGGARLGAYREAEVRFMYKHGARRPVGPELIRTIARDRLGMIRDCSKLFDSVLACWSMVVEIAYVLRRMREWEARYTVEFPSLRAGPPCARDADVCTLARRSRAGCCRSAGENYTRWLAERRYDATRNDLPSDLEGHVRLKHEGGVVRYAPGDAFSLHFGKLFDLVLITEIIEHVAHPDELLSHVTRLTRAGGHVLLSTPSGAYFSAGIGRASPTR